jgi:hypothetical protein
VTEMADFDRSVAISPRLLARDVLQHTAAGAVIGGLLRRHRMRWFRMDIVAPSVDTGRLRTHSNDDFQHEGNAQWATKAARRTKTRARNRRRSSRGKQRKGSSSQSEQALFTGAARVVLCAAWWVRCPGTTSSQACQRWANATFDFASRGRVVPCMVPTCC